MKKIIFLWLMLLICILLIADENLVQNTETVPTDSVQTAKITFLELGSLTCIPCQQMEKVLESIREKYGDQIEVIFQDIKKKKDIAKKFKVRMMPTQVFLDANGKEIHRHIGFYPEELIDEFLKDQGLEIIPVKQIE